MTTNVDLARGEKERAGENNKLQIVIRNECGLSLNLSSSEYEIS